MKLGPYELVAKIAEGGFGTVFEARDAASARVAVKVLRVVDPEAIERFERERRLLAALGPADGFVPLLDAGSGPEGPWLAMPFLDGGTLRDRLRRGPLAVAEALALLRVLARALGAAHARGIVHRDLKPENVLFDASGRAFVSDLGLAKHLRRAAPRRGESGSLTAFGEALGTLGYMAPEQLDDAKTVGPPADVFALAAIAYECLAGARPFDASSVLAFTRSIQRGRPRSLRALGVAVPGRLDAELLRALDPSPAARPSDAVAFARALAAAEAPRRGPLFAASALLAAATAAALLLASRRPPPSPPPRSSPPPPARPTPPPPPPPKPPTSTYEEAKRAVALTPDDASAWIALGLRARERVHGLQSIEQIDLARESTDAFLRATELAPAAGEAWFWLGRNRIEYFRDDADAVEDFDRACRTNPNAANWIAHRGWARARTQDYARAIADFDEAIELAPGETLFRRWRSECREATGDIAGAISDIEAIQRLAKDPSDSQRLKVDQRLAALRARVGR